MEIELVHGWATPSTLHLRLMVGWGKKRRWQFATIDIPLATLKGVGWLPQDQPAEDLSTDQPLPGLE